MRKKLSDLQKKSICADRVKGLSYRQIADKYELAVSTVQGVLKSNPETVHLSTLKKEENTQTVLDCMTRETEQVCQFLSQALHVLNEPGKLEEATLPQITTAIGILIDKWTALADKTAGDREIVVRLEGMDGSWTE